MKILRPGIVLALVLVLLAGTALAKGDLIKRTDDKWHMGGSESKDRPAPKDYENSLITVKEENYDKVVYDLKLPNGRNQRQSIDADKVKQVFYYEIHYMPPNAWREAVSAMGDGRFTDSIARFESIANNRQSSEALRMYALVNLARIYQLQGAYPMAITTWDRLQKDFPKSRFIDEAIVQQGLAQFYSNDLGEAQRTLGKLERVQGLPEGKKMLGRYWLIFLKQQQGEQQKNTALINAALGEYRRLLSDVQGNSALQDVEIRARLGIGECTVALKQFEEALQFFEKIADSSGDPQVLAGAFNGLGRCYFEQRKYKDALLAYLRTVVLYNENAEQEARALYNAGWCYELWKGESWKDRAKSLYSDCIRKYGAGSRWGALAQDGLNRIR